MKTIKLFSAVILSTLLAGCSSTGGTIGGMIPAPKFTRGDFKNSQYTAKDNSFKVDSPFKSASYAERYMEIAESYQAGEIQVAFSSSAAPAEVYRVRVFDNVQNEEGFQSLLLERSAANYEQSYGTALKQINSGSLNINGLKVDTTTFRQKIPERSEGLRRLEGFDTLHSAFYMKKGNKIAFIWINRMPPGQEIMTSGAEARIEAFVRSFELM
ncbi:hypothetical protein ACWJJH_03030 [Endozoicomonadaceae bacterium StTr2]